MTTATAPRTAAELEAAATAAVPDGLNAQYRRLQHVRRFIENAEHEAYRIEDRRTVRARYLAGLAEHATFTAGVSRGAMSAAMTVQRATGHGLKSHTNDTLTCRCGAVLENEGGLFTAVEDHTADVEPAYRQLRESATYAREAAERAADQLLEAKLPGSEARYLIDLAEQGQIIEPAHLLATVPDEYGRIFPFCVYVRPAGASREYASRNLSLATAVRMHADGAMRGDRVTVSFDTCG